MSKYFARAFGGYKAENRVVVIHVETIEAKKTPKCQALIVEAIRGDRKEKTKKISIDGGFPLLANTQVSLVSQFFVDKDKVQDKDMTIKVYGCSAGKSDTVLGETNFNIARFYNHKNQSLKLPIRDGFFTLHAKVSVVQTSDAVNVMHVDQTKIDNSMQGYDGSVVVGHHKKNKSRSRSRSRSKSPKDKKKDGKKKVDQEAFETMEKTVKALEAKLAKKKAKAQKTKVLVSENQVAVEVANLMNLLNAQKEANLVLVRRIKELDEKTHHKDQLHFELEEKLGYCKKTIDEHMNRLMHAAQESDAKRHAEMKKSQMMVDEDGKDKVSLHFSYESQHSVVMKATLDNMQRMHKLDQHRIHELEERVRLLEHQAHVDFEREHRMIEEWEHAIEEENKMRMDIHKMQIAMSHHAEERAHHLKLSNSSVGEKGHWKEKYEGLSQEYEKIKNDYKDYKDKKKKKSKELKKERNELAEKLNHIEHEYHEFRERFDHIHHELEHIKNEYHGFKVKAEGEIHSYKEYIEKDKHGDHEKFQQYEVLRKEYESVKHELHEITVKYHQTKDELHHIKDSTQGLKEKLHVALDDDDEDKAKIHHLRSKCDHQEKEIQDLKEECRHWEAKYHSTQKELDETKKELHATQIKLHHLDSKQDQLEGQLKVTQVKLHHAKEDDKEDEQDIKELKIKLRVAHEKIENLEEELKISHAKLKFAQQDDNEDEREIKTLQINVRVQHEKIEKLQRELKEAEYKYKNASSDDLKDDIVIKGLKEKCYHLEQKVMHLEGELSQVEEYKREAILYRARYERQCRHNATLKSRHVTLKVSYRQAGHHHTSSSSSSKSD